MKAAIKKHIKIVLSLTLAFAIMAPLIPLRKLNIAKQYNLQLIEEEDLSENQLIEELDVLFSSVEFNTLKKLVMCNLYVTPSFELIFLEHPYPPPR